MPKILDDAGNEKQAIRTVSYQLASALNFRVVVANLTVRVYDHPFPELSAEELLNIVCNGIDLEDPRCEITDSLQEAN